MELNGKVALVTGAGLENGRPGIGYGCAYALAREGMNIMLCDISEERLKNAQGALESVGTDCEIFCADAFNHDDIKSLAAETIRCFGGIDVLVTGPASSINKYVTELSPEEYLKTLNDVVVSHTHLGQLAANDMIKRKVPGRIIYIASVYGTQVRKKHLGYDTGKAALIQATKDFARELGQHDILVNAISPGFTDTPNERLYANDEQVKEIVSGLLLRRAVSVQGIGKLARFLAETDDVTGQNIVIAAGMDLVDFTYNKEEAR